MTSDRRRTPRNGRDILDQLQDLADRPQLRHRLGFVSYADSRRPTQNGLMDYRTYHRDQDRNYAAGLL